MLTTSKMDAGAVIWVIILSVVASFIFSSNLCIFIAVYRSPRLRNRGNVFILCLACSDFLVSVFNVPFTAASSLDPSIRGTGSTLCNVTGFLEMTFLIASVFSVTVINLHRYIYIVYWTKYYKIFHNKLIILIIGSLWTSAVVLSAPPLFQLSKIVYKSGKSHCFVDWKVTPGYTFSLITICFLVPVVSMALCYYRIYRFRQKSKILMEKLCNGITPSASHTKLDLAAERSRRNSHDSSIANYDATEKAQNGTAKTIVAFLNESMAELTKLAPIELRDLSKASGNGEGISNVLKDCEKDEVSSHEDCLVDGELETQRVNHVDLIEKKSLDQTGSGKKRRKSRMMSIEKEPKDFKATGTLTRNRKKSEGMWKEEANHLAKRQDLIVGHRQIEIFVEESVTSADVQPSKNVEYNFQICSSKMKDNQERYVVKRAKKSNEERRLTTMCVAIVAVFFASWFPFVVTMVIESLTTLKIPPVVDKATLLIGYLNSLSNPLIYCYFNRNFREQLKKLFFKRTSRRTLNTRF